MAAVQLSAHLARDDSGTRVIRFVASANDRRAAVRRFEPSASPSRRYCRATHCGKGELVPTNLSEFADESAFERYVIDRAAPLLPLPEGTSKVELSVAVNGDVSPGTHMFINLTESLGSSPQGLTIDNVRPLLFGAGWKILDLLTELALEQAGVAHDQGSRYTIKRKADLARSGQVAATAPFGTQADLWSRVMATYAATMELRHSLVHRRINVSASGEISGVLSSGVQTSLTVTAEQQLRFCNMVAGATDAILSVSLPKRRLDRLRWVLDELDVLHQMPRYGVPANSGPVPVVLLRAAPNEAQTITINIDDVNRRARAAFQDVSYFDLGILLPDGRTLRCALEDAPSGLVSFSSFQPPSWLH